VTTNLVGGMGLDASAEEGECGKSHGGEEHGYRGGGI
jgi:hypothetical protein